MQTISFSTKVTPIWLYKQVLTEREYQEAYDKWGDRFRVGMGAEAVKELLEAIDMEKDSEELKKGLKESYRSEDEQESSNVWRLWRHSASPETNPSGWS